MAFFWNLQALLAKIETAYGTDSAPTGAANAILASNVRVMPMEGQDTSREHERPYLGARPTIPSGLYAKITFTVELKGSGTAGTPPATGVLLRACAMGETIVAATSVTYNPVSSGHESISIYFNSDGTNYKFIGTRGDCKYRLTAQGIVVLDFEFTGLFSQPAAAALPTPVYGTQLTQIPQVATTANTPTFSVGGTSLVLRSFELAAGNDVQTRFLIRSESVIIPDRSETVTATVDAVALATFNPYALAAAQTTQAISLVHGVGAGKVCTLSIPTAQVLRPAGLEQQQKVVEWPLRFLPLPNAGNDQYTIAFT